MADEDESQKTEEPTGKKLRDAEEKGEVPQSQEIKTWFMLAAAAVLLITSTGIIGANVAMPMVAFLSNAHNYDMDQVGAMQPVMLILWRVMLVMLIPFSVFVLAAFAGSRVQHGWVFTLEKLKPDLTKLSPLSGAKKIFSSRSVIELFKTIGKLIAVSYALFVIVYPERGRLDTLMLLSMKDVLSVTMLMAFKLVLGVLIILTIIAAIDNAYQRYQYYKKLRMTKQEVKDENKQSDGDPLVKGRLRSIRMQRARERMMAAVPGADVVITNPTHYAVALAYKHGEMEVPKLVAKGVDDIALKIREIAMEHGVPIVENPPLARALHASVDLDEEVPPDHYKAVAEVISYVMKLKRAGLGAFKR